MHLKYSDTVGVQSAGLTNILLYDEHETGGWLKHFLKYFCGTMGISLADVSQIF
jgi:hypothetical protein